MPAERRLGVWKAGPRPGLLHDLDQTLLSGLALGFLEGLALYSRAEGLQVMQQA